MKLKGERLRDERELVPYFFHEPERRGCRAANTDFESGELRVESREFFFQFVGGGDKERVGVRLQTVVVEDAGVGGFGTSDEEDEVLLPRKILQPRHAVGYVAADGVVCFQHNLRFEIGDLRLDSFHEGVETFDGLGGLGEEVYRACEVEPVKLVGGLDDDRGVVGLPLESDDLGVAGFAVDDDLRREGLVVLVGLIAGADTVLQFLDDGAGGVNDLYAPLARYPVGGRRFAVGTEEHARVGRQRAEVVIVDGLKTEGLQTGDLLTVMDDVAQATKSSGTELSLRCGDGTGDTEAETAVLIDGYDHSGYSS